MTFSLRGEIGVVVVGWGSGFTLGWLFLLLLVNLLFLDLLLLSILRGAVGHGYSPIVTFGET